MSPLCTSLLSLSVCVWSWLAAVVWLSPLRPPGCARRSSVRLSAAVAAAFSCVPRGQRALLDADMLALIDRSTCLVEPVAVGVLCSSRACAPQQARPRRVLSLLANVPSATLCGRSFAPELLTPSCSCRITAMHGLGVAACTWVTACFLSSVVHLTSCPCTKKNFTLLFIEGHTPQPQLSSTIERLSTVSLTTCRVIASCSDHTVTSFR